MLNAISTFEVGKSEPVIQSLDFAFSASPVTRVEAPSQQSDPMESVKDGDTLDKLKALFQSQLTAIDAKKNRLGTEMHIRLPVTALEQALMQPGQTEYDENQPIDSIGGFFLPTLVSLVQSDESGVSYSMSMVLNVEDNPAKLYNSNAATIEADLAKIAVFAEIIERAGLPKKLSSPGLAAGTRGYVDLYFKRYSPYNPLGSDGGG